MIIMTWKYNTFNDYIKGITATNFLQLGTKITTNKHINVYGLV